MLEQSERSEVKNKWCKSSSLAFLHKGEILLCSRWPIS